MKFARKFLADLVSLRQPVTAAAVVATGIAIVKPFGLDVGPDAPVLTGTLVAVGVLAAYVRSLLGT